MGIRTLHFSSFIGLITAALPEAWGSADEGTPRPPAPMTPRRTTMGIRPLRFGSLVAVIAAALPEAWDSADDGTPRSPAPMTPRRTPMGIRTLHFGSFIAVIAAALLGACGSTEVGGPEGSLPRAAVGDRPLATAGPSATALPATANLPALLELVMIAPTPDQALHETLWRTLSVADDATLSQLGSRFDSYVVRGWIELARANRAAALSLRSQLDAYIRWQRVWVRHPAVAAPPAELRAIDSAWAARPRHVALILPLQSSAGAAIEQGFLSAYYRSLTGSRDLPRVTLFDSTGVTTVHRVYDAAVASGAELVIGPLDKALVNQLGQLRQLPVPTLALNYTDSAGSEPTRNLYQFGLAPEDEIAQLASLAREAGHRKGALLIPASAGYDRLREAFAANWEVLGGDLVAVSQYATDTDYTAVVKQLLGIAASEARLESLVAALPRRNVEFIPRRRQDVDFILLVANPRTGRQIMPTLAFYFADPIPVYSLPSIYDGIDNPVSDLDLNGIVFADGPWMLPGSDPLRQLTDSMLEPAQGAVQRLRAFGVDAFRLQERLVMLATLDGPVLHGSTGLLRVLTDGRVQRQLRLARFERGSAITVAEH